MQTVLKKDLDMSSYRVIKTQLLTQDTKAKRVQRSKLFLKSLRDGT